MSKGQVVPVVGVTLFLHDEKFVHELAMLGHGW